MSNSPSPPPPEKIAIFTWGRMNPPTLGHARLIDNVLNRAAELKADPYFVITHTQNSKKNPFSQDEKEEILKLMFPSIKFWKSSKEEPNPAFVVNRLRSDGYTKVYFMLGSDRKTNFKFMNNIDIVKRLPGIERNKKAQGPEGISGTKVRKYAKHAARGSTRGLRRFLRSMHPAVNHEQIIRLINERITKLPLPLSPKSPNSNSPNSPNLKRNRSPSPEKATSPPSPKKAKSASSTGTRSSVRPRVKNLN